MTTKTIAGSCPICLTAVPLFTITFRVKGWFRRRVGFTVDADATDYVMHMWAHSQKGESWR